MNRQPIISVRPLVPVAFFAHPDTLDRMIREGFAVETPEVEGFVRGHEYLGLPVIADAKTPLGRCDMMIGPQFVVD